MSISPNKRKQKFQSDGEGKMDKEVVEDRSVKQLYVKSCV